MNMKKLSRIIPVILLTTLLVVSSIFVLASCGGDNEGDTSGVTDIFFAKSGSPRKTYVIGQDLDLTQGTHTVVIDGENTSLALNAEGVTVTGFGAHGLHFGAVTLVQLLRTAEVSSKRAPPTPRANDKARSRCPSVF